MNERIKELAVEADEYAEQTVHYYQGQFDGLTWEGQIKQVRDKKFAELVIADEREACAQLCDELIAPDGYSDRELSMWDVTCIDCAAAIRARSET